MSYAPVNNTLVLKGKRKYVSDVLLDRSIMDRLNEVCNDTEHLKLKDFDPNPESEDVLLWLYYETNCEPHEEVPVFIKKKYPKLRVFFSSIDHDEWCFAYYKEFGMDGIDPEYNYGTRNEEKIDKIFDNFVSN